MPLSPERILQQGGLHPSNQSSSYFFSVAMLFLHFLLTADVYTKMTYVKLMLGQRIESDLTILQQSSASDVTTPSQAWEDRPIHREVL
jgi:hypothetical protein